MNAKVFLYTRSKTEDYRWVYTNFFVESNQLLLDDEWGIFFRNRKKYLEKRPLFVRKTEAGLSVYRFLKTEHEDRDRRPIYGLAGCTFSNKHDIEEISKTFAEFVCYFFLHFDDIIPVFNEISDDMKDETFCFDFDIREIQAKCQNNTEFEELVTSFKQQYRNTYCTGFMFSESTIKPFADAVPNVKDPQNEHTKSSTKILIAKGDAYKISTNPLPIIVLILIICSWLPVHLLDIILTLIKCLFL